ncbi:protein translocase subunit SecD [bacterium]|nr:MAG: protein translocase subunit SecD [bacterium]
MKKTRFLAVLLVLCGLGLAYFDFASESKHFAILDKVNISPKASLQKFSLKLGLDLQGGTHMVYKANTNKLVGATDVNTSMNALRDVIERRVNLFGVAEPLVQVEQSSSFTEGGQQQRLIVELPGVTDVQKAVAMIGATPILEFKVERPKAETDAIVKAKEEAQKLSTEAQKNGTQLDQSKINPLAFEDVYASTELTGQFLKKSSLDLSQFGEPKVALEFNDQGKDLFAKITKENVGKTVAIYLDGSPISAPRVNEEIDSGNAVISGSFTIEEAKTLVGRLNSGALPVSIELLSTQSVGSSLGGEAYNSILLAGLYGFLIVVLFMLLWYRFPGLIATISLSIYAAIMIAIFKTLPVTMTAAGIAGFILTIGMAVDANILIFARMKEELKKGRGVHDAVLEGFARAWTSIRDSNLSTIISAIILFWFGTSMIKGFALVLGIGVVVSMFTALTVTRTLLLAIGVDGESKFTRFLFGSGIKN